MYLSRKCICRVLMYSIYHRKSPEDPIQGENGVREDFEISQRLYHIFMALFLWYGAPFPNQITHHN